MWGNSFDFWNNNLESFKYLFGFFVSGKEVNFVSSHFFSSLSFHFVKHNKSVFSSFNIFLEISSSSSKRFDGHGSFRDFVSGMIHSSLESCKSGVTFFLFGG